jgi:hypothetical protein
MYMLVTYTSIYNMYKAYVSPGWEQQIMLFLSSLGYNGSLVIWTVVCLPVTKFKPLVLSVPGFVLSNIANIYIYFPFTTYWVSDTKRTAEKTPG